MMTPTTMATSMITTATTMITDVVVVPSLGRLLVGCELLLTMKVPVVVVASQLGGIGCMLLLIGTVLVVVTEAGVILAVVDAVER